MESLPTVSVIIPTYNRKDWLLRTLDSLRQQTLPADRYEVIVVDDGSTDDTGEIVKLPFPFSLRYACQANSGDAQARNTGAQLAQAEYLVFVDDDIIPDRDCLTSFLATLQAHQRAAILGNLKPVMPDPPQPFHLHFARVLPVDPSLSGNGKVPFTECLSGFMAIRRADYFAIGMMERLNTRGANPWCDVDFAYRAHQLGYSFYYCQGAIGHHHDGALQDFAAFCQRCEKVNQLGARLFHKHPDLRGMIPTFCDKEPLSLATDSPRLIMRKVLRRLLSSSPSVAAMKRLIYVLEKYKPGSFLLVLLYRWVISAYLYKGYRRGLRELVETNKKCDSSRLVNVQSTSISGVSQHRNPISMNRKLASVMDITANYQVLRVLGQGGEGTVYLVKDRAEARRLVLKVFHEPRPRAWVPGLEIYANSVAPNDCGLPVIRLLQDSDQIIGIQYPFVQLYQIHPRVLRLSERVAQALFGAYCRMQSYLMSEFGIGLWDVMVDHFMIAKGGQCHYVDFGYGVQTINQPRCLEQGLLGYGFSMLLLSIHGKNIRLVVPTSKDYSYDKPCIYCMNKELDAVAAQHSWAREVLFEVRGHKASIFHDPEFYRRLGERFPGRIPVPPLIIWASRFLFRLGKIRAKLT